jgi:hypothetical protein
MVPESNPGGGQGFSALIHTGCRAHSASYTMETGGKAVGAWRWPNVPSSAEVKERVELYLYYPSGPSCSVLGWSVPLLFTLESNCFSQTGSVENLSQNARDLLFFRTASSYSRIRWSYLMEQVNILHGQQIISFIKLMHISWEACEFLIELPYVIQNLRISYSQSTASQTIWTWFNEPVTFSGCTPSYCSHNP